VSNAEARPGADADWESTATDPERSLDGLGGRLRDVRRRRGLTLEEVASGAGITLGYLSQIERDVTVPTLPTLARVAAKLGVPMARLFTPEGASPYGVIRRGERRRFAELDENLVQEQLTPTLGGHLHAFAYSLDAGRSTELTVHAGDEFAIVLVGQVEYTVGGERYRLAEGDCLYFDATQPHRVGNVGDRRATWLWVNTRPG
jgi:transcriptional regulator with XRE-family HTH domain